MLIDNNDIVRNNVYDFLAECAKRDIKVTREQIIKETGLGRTRFLNWMKGRTSYKFHELQLLNDYINEMKTTLGLEEGDERIY